MLPMYREHTIRAGQGAERNVQFVGAHTGLWFERFFNQYNDQFMVDESAKRKFLEDIKSLNGSAHGYCGHVAELKRAWCARQAMVQACGGRMLTRQAAWHFVTGLGYPHPVENGLLFHPTLVVPYLPGSSVKGLVRAWIEQQMPDPGEALQRIFGSEHKDPAVAQQDFTAGEIIFFDALPIQPVKLVVDTMTPHLGRWYEQGGGAQADMPSTVPADWHDPVPVPFIAVSEVVMLFSFAPRVPRDDTVALLEFVEGVLSEALKRLGAGAKTGAGYGLFVELSDAQQAYVERLEQDHRRVEEEQLKARKTKDLSPEALVLLELGEQAEKPANWPPGCAFHRELCEQIEKAVSWPVTERQALAQFAEGFFKAHASKKKFKDYKILINKLK